MVKEFLSAADKKIYDSIHGFIRFDRVERKLIDSMPFQRLHYVHQLGIAYLVYPGATHSRFEHSLGVMELATRIFDKICKSPRPDVFQHVPRKGSAEYFYWRKVLRLAALCHDLGHPPFSHVAEKDLLGEVGHEKWTQEVIFSDYLAPIWNEVKEDSDFPEVLEERDLVEDIAKAAIGPYKWNQLNQGEYTAWEKIISSVITGDFFGAGRIDYLLRDAKCTGVAYGLFDYQQLIEMLRILPAVDGDEDDLELGIDENGIESCEALLLARHFMHRRVYRYSPVKAYNFHLKRFMRKMFKPEDFAHLEDFLKMSDIDVISELLKASRDRKHFGHDDARRIVHRQDRYKVIPLPPHITEEELSDFRKKNKIEENALVWEIYSKPKGEEGWSFPVARRHFLLEKAKDCSELLYKVPPSSRNWIFVAPEYEMLVVHALEKWKS